MKLIILFTFNHQNYAKWLCRFNDNLENIEKSNAEFAQLQNGAFSIRRSNRNFSRSPIDLTLEQTINANAGNRLKGISAFTNNINARKKWATTHSIRTFRVHQFYEFIGIINLHDLSENHSKTKVYAERVDRFICAVEESLNPFQENLNPNYLYNLSSGKAASEDTANFLLNVISTGKHQLNSFIKECLLCPKRFDQPIRRNKIKTFSSEICKPHENTAVHEKIDEIKLEKHVIWRILSMAVGRNIDLEMVLSYPLTNVPHSLAYPDGTSCSKT